MHFIGMISDIEGVEIEKGEFRDFVSFGDDWRLRFQNFSS